MKAMDTRQVTRTNDGPGDRLFTPGFAAIVAAEAFSLLGAEILQFVLPLHLLNLTGSGMLYGGVIAAGFVPYVALSPIGGILADRTRKRGVMAALNLLMAGAMGVYILCSGSPAAVVPVTVGVLMVAFAFQALYQPCVQSAVPRVVSAARIPQATAVTNQLGMLTGIGGPVLGGLVFGFFGLAPIATVSAVSFAVSALLVILIVRVPYEPPARTRGVFATAVEDLREALVFLRSRSALWHVIVAATLVNLFGASFINVGTPFVVTETLGLSNQLLGFVQAALAVGGLLGGAVVALRPQAFTMRSLAWLLPLGAAGVGVVALALALPIGVACAFAALLVGYVLTMACCMAFSIAATSQLQLESPETLVGKVMALTMMLANLATPAGQIAFGAAFDAVPAWVAAVLAAASMAVVGAWLARVNRRG